MKKQIFKALFLTPILTLAACNSNHAIDEKLSYDDKTHFHVCSDHCGRTYRKSPHTFIDDFNYEEIKAEHEVDINYECSLCGKQIDKIYHQHSTSKHSLASSDETYINYKGRYNITGNGAQMSWSGTSFEIKFNVKNENEEVTVLADLESNIKVSSYKNQYIHIYVDDVLFNKKGIKDGSFNNVLLYQGTLNTGTHKIEVIKANEANHCDLILKNINFYGNLDFSAKESAKPIIEFYGDSISCGYGNLGLNTENDFKTETEDELYAYPYLLAKKLNLTPSVVAMSGIHIALSPFNETSPGMLSYWNTLDCSKNYDMSKTIPNYVVINLGTNDNTKYKTLAGEQKTNGKALFLSNYKQLIKNCYDRNNNTKFVLLYDMMVNFDDDLVENLNLANEYANTLKANSSILFKLPNVDIGGVHGHPCMEAHENNTEILKNVLKVFFEI